MDWQDWLPLSRPQTGTWPATQVRALTGNRTSNLLLCRPEVNPLSHMSQHVHVDFLKLRTQCVLVTGISFIQQIISKPRNNLLHKLFSEICIFLKCPCQLKKHIASCYYVYLLLVRIFYNVFVIFI